MIFRKNWEKIERDFFEVLKKFSFKIEYSYICDISPFGPAGQFKYPNMINLRLNNNKDIDVTNETIAHKLIHLAIIRVISIHMEVFKCRLLTSNNYGYIFKTERSLNKKLTEKLRR